MSSLNFYLAVVSWIWVAAYEIFTIKLQTLKVIWIADLDDIEKFFKYMLLL